MIVPHEDIQRVKFLLVREKLHRAMADYAGIGHGAVHFLLLKQKLVVEVHLKCYAVVFFQEVKLCALHGRMKVEIHLFTLHVNAEVQRDEIWIRLIVNRKTADIALAYDAQNFCKIRNFPVFSAHKSSLRCLLCIL